MMFPIPYPPLETAAMSGVCGTGDLCSRNNHFAGLGGLAALSQLSPFSAILGGAGSAITAIEQKKAADEQASLETQQLKLEKLQNAQNFAEAQAEAQAKPSEEKRMIQTVALFGVGGVALLVSGIFLISAMKKK
jgi:hypothetical protein